MLLGRRRFVVLFSSFYVTSAFLRRLFAQLLSFALSVLWLSTGERLSKEDDEYMAKAKAVPPFEVPPATVAAETLEGVRYLPPSFEHDGTVGAEEEDECGGIQAFTDVLPPGPALTWW